MRALEEASAGAGSLVASQEVARDEILASLMAALDHHQGQAFWAAAASLAKGQGAVDMAQPLAPPKPRG